MRLQAKTIWNLTKLDTRNDICPDPGLTAMSSLALRRGLVHMLKQLADRHAEKDAQLVERFYVETSCGAVPEAVSGVRVNLGTLPKLISSLYASALGYVPYPPDDHICVI